MIDGTPILQATGIRKSFADGAHSTLAVLDGIDLSLRMGETLCIVGSSGCGKSTLLRILAAIETADHGNVTLGAPVAERGFAYVQQTPHLLPWRTVAQNAAIGLEINGRLGRPAVDALIGKLQLFGLSGFEHALPENLSGGMRQKAALVCALAAKPALLYCDEPFSAIDFVTRLQLLDIFKCQCVVEKIAAIHVTHNIEEAIFLGDEVMVLSPRPARIVARYPVRLGENRHDPIACRETPEFVDLFRRIWESLRHDI